jgi:hypothetical protein
MASFKSILPFWRSLVSPVTGSPLPASHAAEMNDFGAGSSLELQFGRLMDDPQTDRPALFSSKSCRA